MFYLTTPNTHLSYGHMVKITWATFFLRLAARGLRTFAGTK